jgi:hypothetical protein
MIGLRTSVSGAVISLLCLAACGGGTSSPAPGAPPDQASSSLSLVRSSTGPSPKAGSVSGNGSPTIVNGDGTPHDLTSNAYPHQLNCPELNSLMVAPGDQFRAAIANQNRTCALIDILILLIRASAPPKVTTAGRSPWGDGNGGGGSGY